MSRRTIVFLLISAAAAALFVRLGFWQIARLHERRAYVAAVGARLGEPPAPLDALPRDSAARHYRRVRIEGRPDYAHDIVLSNRSHDGSPGVNVLTPVHVAGRDTLILVDRGWVYSPNGSAIDLSHWREADTVAADGWIEYPSRRPGVARASAPRTLQWLDVAEAAALAGGPVTPFYVVLDSVGASSRDRPIRLSRPALDEGPHKSYAIQWFCFAIVAIVGGAVFARERA